MLLAENVNGSYKNELIHSRRWDDVVEVEIATFEWVSWWNETRLHQSLGYRTPVEVETEFWKQNPPQEIIEIKANALEQNSGHFNPTVGVTRSEAS
ncbi:integrase core domain-containing protein [Corynebacterium sp. YSMAA1_1_F7]|uniref:integrase core domain-containing protein n=1 Tax=Corynebacterium sp. YSMAA1_1_F7 TaxID=3383590 RepID=UPI0038D1A663